MAEQNETEQAIKEKANMQKEAARMERTKPDQEYKSNEATSKIEEADIGRRITAAFIDCCAALFLFFFVGWLGSFRWLSFIQASHFFWIVPIVYMLIRDMYVDGKPLSLGKRLAGLDVVIEKTNKNPDFVGSLQRNIMFVFPPLSLCMAGLEVYLLFKNNPRRRFGDHFGKTIVIQKKL